jgi:hypothetical protein
MAPSAFRPLARADAGAGRPQWEGTMTTRNFTAALLACATLVSACGGAERPAPAAAPVAATPGERVTAAGTFIGESGHVSSGGVEVVNRGGQWIIRLGADFKLDGGPDPKVALGKNGFRPESILASLGALNGAQEYALKPGLDIGNYTQVYIWCEEFAVPLARADLRLR